LNKEFAIGAVSLESMIVDEHLDIPKNYINEEIFRLRKSLQEKYKLYMGGREPLDITGKNAIIVDDGIATGNTLLASIAMLRKRKPEKIIVAIPVLPKDVVLKIKNKVDELVYIMAPEYFRGVGGFYEHFDQVQDEEVIQQLSEMSFAK
jgi:predicted phosphoribosyltransferase